MPGSDETVNVDKDAAVAGAVAVGVANPTEPASKSDDVALGVEIESEKLAPGADSTSGLPVDSVTFQFPSPPAERVSLAVLSMVGVAWIPLFILFLQRQTHEEFEAVGDLLVASTRLRSLTALMGIVVCIGLVLVLSYLSTKRNTRLTASTTGVRYVRPGLPLVGWLARDIHIPKSLVSKVIVEPVRRWTVSRVELRIEGAATDIRVNLEHATGPNLPTRKRAGPIRERRKHPLVQAVCSQLGVDAEMR